MRKIELHRGEKYVLELEGLGTAGYTWQHTVDGASQAIKIVIETVRPLPKLPNGKIPPPSFNVDQLFTVTALKKGHVRIHLVHLRPWEHEKEPLREILLDVDIVE